MKRKTEKCDFGKALSCIRLACGNQSIAEMANALEISPTYLNAIEGNLRPCTFEILNKVFNRFVYDRHITELNSPILSPQNIFAYAWKTGLYTTLGIPLSPKQAYDILVENTLQSNISLLENTRKQELLNEFKGNFEIIDQIPADYFEDKEFVDNLLTVAKDCVTSNLSKGISDELVKEIFSLIARVQKKCTLSIKRCGETRNELLSMLNGLEEVNYQTLEKKEA